MLWRYDTKGVMQQFNEGIDIVFSPHQLYLKILSWIKTILTDEAQARSYLLLHRDVQDALKASNKMCGVIAILQHITHLKLMP